ncbi:MAG: TraB/GumN family protein [Bacteroidetes bacterium]|nr:TraB/GumN family protein [Bacteroidota bacterium]
MLQKIKTRKKERSYGDWDEAYSTDQLQEAYRRGNLDLLDSINKYNSFSAAFDEKFLYRRNEIQAGSIDSILRSGTFLFAGVGAAHLPGDRGGD